MLLADGHGRRELEARGSLSGTSMLLASVETTGLVVMKERLD